MKKGNIPTTVDEYLQPLTTPVKETLGKLRKAIKAAAPPDVDEIISYQIPMYKRDGALVGFAAFPKHCSFFVVSKDILKIFADELKSFDTSGTTIHFSPEQPIPSSLISKIVKHRLMQNAELAAIKNLAKRSSGVKKSKVATAAKQTSKVTRKS
jgi:uncharacterized protein YdhG (YjbR/CyaY superfamily)